MKTLSWNLTTEEETHHITYRAAPISGKVTVTIDGEAFTLSAGFLCLRAARREIFRLGDEQAILVVDQRGHTSLLFRNTVYPPVIE